MSIIQASSPYIKVTAKGQTSLISPAYYFNDNEEKQPYLHLDDIIDHMKLDDYYISFADIASAIKSNTCIIVYNNNTDEDTVLVTPRDALRLLSKYSTENDRLFTNDLVNWIKESFAKWVD